MRETLNPCVFIALAMASSCSWETGPTSGSGSEVLAAAELRLSARLHAIRDYVLEGTAREAGVEMRFTYAFAQPQFARLDIADEQTIIFDGQTLLALDHRTKTAARLDKSSGEEQLLLALHQTFSPFASEGWRPPLLRQGLTRASASQGPDGPRWTLAIPIDDPQLLEERVVLRDDGAFVEKSTVDRAGNTVAATRVLENLVDPETGLTFPRRWEKKGALGSLGVDLGRAAVNKGISRESFRTTLPPGYTLAEKGPT